MLPGVRRSVRLPPENQSCNEAVLTGNERMWAIKSSEINGGFLPGVTVELPDGLTCIIGLRGSGKSTLAELVRFAICGLPGAPKSRQEITQASLGNAGLMTLRTLVRDGLA